MRVCLQACKRVLYCHVCRPMRNSISALGSEAVRLLLQLQLPCADALLPAAGGAFLCQQLCFLQQPEASRMMFPV